VAANGHNRAACLFVEVVSLQNQGRSHRPSGFLHHLAAVRKKPSTPCSPISRAIPMFG
jgi:hypothetical protein